MEQPAVYRICIQGELKANWAEYFSAQSVLVEQSEEGKVVTVLVSDPMDQGALVGLINYLNGLGIKLLSVEPVTVQ